MSLVRLLTTGKSLVSVKDAESRYRVTSQRLLPQFGPARNPFSRKAKSEPVQTEQRALGEIGDRARSGEEQGASLPSGLENRMALASSRAVGFGGLLRLRTAALLSGWEAKLSGLLVRWRRKAAKPAIPRFTPLPVQGELSLDKIKVVRNDLSDSDLEVVPRKAPAMPASHAVGMAGGREGALGRLTARFFGANKC